MDRRGDHETYRGVVYVLCDRYMIAADPFTLNIRVNLDGDKYKYAEINVTMVGYHVSVYDRFHRKTHNSFIREIAHLLSYFDEIIRSK